MYKNHLDGYDQMDLLTGKGPSKRHELFYFGGPALGAIRIDDMKFQFYQQPWGWPGEKTTTDMPVMTNSRQDPFERTWSTRGESTNNGAFGYGNDFYAREFWRFVMVQQYVAKLAMTAVDLLHGDAAPARQILADFRPAMSKEDYLAFQRGLFRTERYRPPES